MTGVMEGYLARIESYLQGCLAEDLPQGRVLEAMRYSLLAGGKRIRPVLTLAFCQLCGGDVDTALPFACAVELVHTYSLIHDDLPCMDDDDLRRGRPTNHKVYGEAGAVLAGDGLQAAAFSMIAGASAPAAARIAGVELLAAAAGPYGMVGGQQLDLDGEGQHLDEAALELLQGLKTGALIRAACRMGVVAAGGSQAQQRAADAYATALGLAFQIRDDMLDRAGDAALLGKPTGSDERRSKSTFASLWGLSVCQNRVDTLTQRACQALGGAAFGDTAFLEDLARQLAGRNA